MKTPRSIHRTVPSLPDGQLADLQSIPARDLMIYRYDKRHISEALLNEFASVGRRFRRSGMLQLADCAPDSGARGIEVWLTRVPREHMSLDVVSLRLDWDGQTPLVEVYTRADLITPELVEQMNKMVLPTACGLLLPVNRDHIRIPH